MTVSHEKRQCERFAVHRGSVANINGHQSYSTITDISATGIAFICSPELHNGDTIDLALELNQGNETKTIHVIVEIVRCLKDDFEFHAGAIIKTITHEFKELLEQIQRSREKYAITA